MGNKITKLALLGCCLGLSALAAKKTITLASVKPICTAPAPVIVPLQGTDLGSCLTAAKVHIVQLKFQLERAEAGCPVDFKKVDSESQTLLTQLEACK